jgi:uncharacterized damage-inducible protein DinB
MTAGVVMSEIIRISDLLKRAFEGDSWHGPSVMEVLAGIDAAVATAKLIATAHSIAEIAAHVGQWESVVRRRLQGENFKVTDAEDWPKFVVTDEASWSALVAMLIREHRALQAAVAAFDEGRLAEIVPGQDYNFYVMLHGVIEHDLYHAGQVALLKKAGGLTP